MQLNQKNSVLVYHDWLNAFEDLPPDEAKQLIIAILKYSASDDEPKANSAVFNMAWNFIKPTLQRDKDAYLEKCKTNAENGARGGRPKKATAKNENQTETEKTERFFEKPKKADNDNDNDSDNDNDNDSDNGNSSVNVKLCNVNGEKNFFGKHKNIPLTLAEYAELKEQCNELDAVLDILSQQMFDSPDKYKEYESVYYVREYIKDYQKSSATEATPPNKI